ncbi:MAG: hypothetical protein JST04_09115 [Bdellovibrionales bacterium]|nr:hypothetical protein [Bdellovibrionales bacterium]
MTNSAYFPTSTHLFEMKGKDARDFLHRLTTTNVRDLEPGDFRAGFFLSPQGKVRAAFRVACRAPDSFYLEVEGGADDAWKTALLGVMDQFTFAEKYELREMSGLKNAWIFGLTTAGENRFDEHTHGTELLLKLHGPKSAFGTHWTSVWGSRATVDRYLAAEGCLWLSESEFERMRVDSLFPRVDRELVPEANPLEIGLRSAIADNKGCYPGQEVIEKIVSLGSPAKRLALLTGVGPRPEAGARLATEDGADAGTVTSAVPREDEGFSALALLRKNAATEGKVLKLAPAPGAAAIDLTIERIADYE